MLNIISANISDIPTIQSVASCAWVHTFKVILSDSQITYMMQLMYSYESLCEQIEIQHHRYFLAKWQDTVVGYMSIEHNCENSGNTKIHKAYILPEKQQKGIGKLLFSVAEAKAKEAGDTAIYLNVNKNNTNAIAFYNRIGFSIIREEVIDIGNGFVMDDFVFEKTIL
ncbi:MAG: GNAT family N-acetyltransferase [Dysgonamonadaceae bacterium]|jgi:ribosomal protein S18 acetylase RimI-like enzyme|nr:GNAT family N-acetyltransferase [Dysgonamonadaceae bacterium]